jgi:hypothetical protein
MSSCIRHTIVTFTSSWDHASDSAVKRRHQLRLFVDRLIDRIGIQSDVPVRSLCIEKSAPDG